MLSKTAGKDRSSRLGLARLVGALAVTWALTSLGLATAASAIPITPAAFDGTQTVESFEGLAAGPNVGTGPFPGLLEPGTTASFTFASGVTLTSPIPNPGTMNNGVFVHDFSVATGTTNNWGSNGNVASATDVPFGSAYIGAFDNLTGSTNPVSMTFTFATDMGLVGAYVTGAGGATVTIRAYDSLGNLLESATVPTVAVASWGSNFLGLSRSEGIRSVTFSGVDFGVDGLTFQAAPVSEPVPPGPGSGWRPDARGLAPAAIRRLRPTLLAGRPGRRHTL